MNTSARLRRTWQASSAIAKVTFQEILRDKVLYNILVCAVLLVVLSVVAARLSFVRQDRLLTNFGLTGLTLSCALIAIFTGAAMVAREYERRTVFVALARPISRLQFVLGKYLGLAGVIFVNWLGLLTALGFLGGMAAPGGLGQLVNSTVAAAVVLVLAQSWVLGALSVFLSTFSTTSLAVMITIGLSLVGLNVSQLRLLAAKVESPVSAALLHAVSNVIPNLEYFNLGTKVSYGLPVDGIAFLGSLAYAVCLIGLLMLGSGALIQRREQ